MVIGSKNGAKDMTMKIFKTRKEANAACRNAVIETGHFLRVSATNKKWADYTPGFIVGGGHKSTGRAVALQENGDVK
jgi:hypothetical protein